MKRTAEDLVTGTASSLELCALQRTPVHAVKFNVSTKYALVIFASLAESINSRASCNTHQHFPQSYTHHTIPHHTTPHRITLTLALSLSMSTSRHREFACI